MLIDAKADVDQTCMRCCGQLVYQMGNIRTILPLKQMLTFTDRRKGGEPRWGPKMTALMEAANGGYEDVVRDPLMSLALLCAASSIENALSHRKRAFVSK